MVVAAVTAGATAVGMGMQYFGAQKQQKAAKEYAALEKQNIALEMAIEGQKRQAMELDTRRKNMEMIRGAQRARALALTSATSQGASQGSGLAGGYGQIQGAVGTNLLGLGQNLAIGRNIFDYNASISQNRMRMADVKAEMGAGAGMSSLGSTISSNAGTIGNLAGAGVSSFNQGFGNQSGPPAYYQPGGYGSMA